MKRNVVFAFVKYATIYMNLSFSMHKECVEKFCVVLSALFLEIKSALIQMCYGQILSIIHREH